MPDLARAGALEELDPYVDKYGYRDELQKIAPTYRDNQMKVDGKIYGFPDDGDVFVLYYRKDIFDDPENQEAFKAKYGYDLPPPKTWKEFDEIGQFLTDKIRAEDLWRRLLPPAALRHVHVPGALPQRGRQVLRRRHHEGDDQQRVGVKVFTDMRAENKFMPPGVEQWGFVENLAAFLAGQTAMTISWPPYGRWAAGYGTDEEALDWVPKSTIAGKVGYALPPGGHPELAAGFCALGRLDEQEQGCRLSVHPVAEQRGDQPSSACSCPTRCAIRSATAHFTEPEYQRAGRRRRNIWRR